MRASHIQSELVDAIDTGAPALEKAYGSIKGALTTETPTLIGTWLRMVLIHLAAPRLAALAGDAGYAIDPDFKIELDFKPGINEPPRAIVLANYSRVSTIHLSWGDGNVYVGGDQARTVDLTSADARSDLIHWLTWAVAGFFGEEDE